MTMADANRKRSRFVRVLDVVGLVLITTGAFLFYVPLGFVVGGLGLWLLAYVTEHE
jgi:hypothetical protein